MDFQNPAMLALLLVIPPLVLAATMLAFRRKEQVRNLYGESRLVDKNSQPLNKRTHLWRAAIIMLGSALLIAALARPTIENGNVEFPEGSTDVVVLVDVSRSMAALDYKGKVSQDPLRGNGTRLDMARYLMMDKIVPALGANRLGIVTYAGEAFPFAFLSNDVSAVDWMQKRAMTIGSASGEGSNLVKAFALAFKVFDLDSKPGNRQLIILMSDGGNDDGLEELNKVISELQRRNIDLVVVGLGTRTPSPIPTAELSPYDQARMRDTEYYMDQGEIALTALDENVLRLFANRMGGRYVRVTNSDDFSFESLAQHLQLKYRKGTQELFTYPLVAGVLFLVLGLLWGEKFSWRSFRLRRRLSRDEE